MRRSASEVIRNLEVRVAKLEKQASDKVLAYHIKLRMDNLRINSTDLTEDPYHINLDDIGFEYRNIRNTISSWIRKGYAEVVHGEQLIDFMEVDVDATILTRKGVEYVMQLVGNSRSARSYQPSEQDAIDESLQLTEYNGWVVLKGPERQSYMSDVWDMYTTTYRKIGITVKDPKVLIGKYKVWYINFDNGVPVAFNLFKPTSFGMKTGLSGNDGSSVGRKVSKSWIKTRWKSVNSFYGEVSGAVEHISIKSGAPVVCAAQVEKVLGKPTNGFKEDNVHYIRDFGGQKHTKIMIGKPRGIDTLPFQKALVQCPIPDGSVRLARHEKTSALEDRLASDCSVYENSLFR